MQPLGQLLAAWQRDDRALARFVSESSSIPMIRVPPNVFANAPISAASTSLASSPILSRQAAGAL
jgi:hypothetical protein